MITVNAPVILDVGTKLLVNLRAGTRPVWSGSGHLSGSKFDILGVSLRINQDDRVFQ